MKIRKELSRMNKQEAIERLKSLSNMFEEVPTGAIAEAISALEQQLTGAWIPVDSGRLPRENETILATIKSESKEMVVLIEYYTNDWLRGAWKLSAWQLLPEPYKEPIS
jgi:hypothetical protein